MLNYYSHGDSTDKVVEACFKVLQYRNLRCSIPKRKNSSVSKFLQVQNRVGYYSDLSLSLTARNTSK